MGKKVEIKSNVQGEVEQLVQVLTEDLKETGEHLRATDSKLTFVFQFYGGFIVLLATLVTGLSKAGIKLTFLEGFPGIGILILLMLLTWWVFIYSLKSRELKKVYINRMNFLRREIHICLGNEYMHLPGYWAVPVGKIPYSLKDGDNKNKDQKDKNKLAIPRVGLDDLYPIGLSAILVVLALLFAVSVVRLAVGTPSSIILIGKLSPERTFLMAMTDVLVPIAFFIVYAWIRSKKKIDDQLAHIWKERACKNSDSMKEDSG